jgi:general secretion pathway protein L
MMRGRRLAALAAAFLRWWRAELRGMLPARLRGRAGPRILLDLRGDGPVVARAARGGRWEPLSTLGAKGAASTALRELRREEQVVLAVPPDWVLRRLLRLPELAAARLDEVLRFEVEQQVPFAADEVLWAARPVRRLPETQRIEVELAVLPRRLVAAAAAAMREAGVAAPLVARSDPGADWPSVPLDALAPPSRQAWRGFAEAALAIIVALLAGHLVTAELGRREAAAAAVEERAGSQRRLAEAAQALEAEAAVLRERLAVAARMRSGRPLAIAVLDEVAHRLPDDAWLVELRLSGDVLVLTGFAARGDGLLQMLDASPLFREVRFTAAVTRVPRDTADRVQVTLRIAPPPDMRDRSPPVQRVVRR